MAETTIPNLDGLPPFPGFDLSVRTVSHRRFPLEGPETYEPVYVRAEIFTDVNVSDEQGLTYFSGDTLNMLSWVPGFYDHGQTLIKPSNGQIRIQYVLRLSFEEWIDFHHTESELGEWLTNRLIPIWLAICIRNNDPERLMGHDILYLADVLNLVLNGVEYEAALSKVPRTSEGI